MNEIVLLLGFTTLVHNLDKFDARYYSRHATGNTQHHRLVIHPLQSTQGRADISPDSGILSCIFCPICDAKCHHI